ncbi:CvfD/Ygs/GSP13 family RNA-binding post-transcriptional regulator [Jeotgalibaca caeni]|uniref:CvfD/Ygs/GSP13 family RNA-binding post-transcriptional regulator n=1 Tax=Jeotgalibaca caeni TaxID=3028623 RepID=UPI00237DACED|nr:CvfD/Ygs/GSP13 family RNA-binding post-transcriptional regulator [Jeotgalibaca caeni]MDE1549178.1 CvfD/Ygs/GSP13 family RNA-binding post-transcriptional regulator [Jeotgalibaca caeni]
MKYKIGDVILGTVTGIQTYGIFVSLDEDTQGLIHISECKHGFVTNLDEVVKVDDEIEAMIIDIDEYTQKISLSLRALEKIQVPPHPPRKKHRKRRYTPQIGFQSLREQMPVWIEEAKLDEKNRTSKTSECYHTN